MGDATVDERSSQAPPAASGSRSSGDCSREGAEVLAVDINAEGMAPLAADGAETLVASVADEADRDRIADGRR